MRTLRTAVLATLVAICATASPAAHGGNIRVVVAEDPSTDRWTVTYRLPEPVAGLRFARSRNRFRAERWRVDPPFRWLPDGDPETVVTDDDGSLADEVTFRFDSDFERKPKDYELNVRFTDGGRLLHLGQLVALPLDAPEDAWRFEWSLRTAPRRRIQLLDRSAVERLVWRPDEAAAPGSTYVYFGGQRPVQSDRMTLILDAGMPAWMEEQGGDLIPELFDYFAGEVALELDVQPLVLLSFEGFDGSGRRFAGGTLPGLVQISAGGEGWREPTADAASDWFKHVAHEIFHLWNGQMFERPLGPTEDWLSEGSADYFALLALRDEGIVTPAEFERTLVAATHDCIDLLDGRPLVDAVERREFDALYRCGSVIQFLADAAVRRATDGAKGIGELFAAMFERGRRRGGEYSTFSFLEELQRLTGDPYSAAPIERLLHQGLGGHTAIFFRDQLRLAGVDLTLGAADPSDALIDRAQAWHETGWLSKPDAAFEGSAAFALAPLLVHVAAPEDGSLARRPRIGAMTLDDRGRRRVEPGVPTVYFAESKVRIEGREHDRRSYVWWYVVPWDRSGVSAVQGIRMTLDEAGFPLLWEVLDDTTAARPLFLAVESESSFDDEADVVVVERLEQGPVPLGPFVYADERTRDVLTLRCRCMPDQVGAILGTDEYRLEPLASLDGIEASLGWVSPYQR